MEDSTIKKWIEDLDSTKFATREQASNELAKAGEAAESALRKTLAGGPSSESKNQIEKILEVIKKRPLSSSTLRELRAVQVLIWIGTPAAKELLRAWAEGDERLALVQAARKALK
ncbi:hypothetical protein KIH39_00545 [Telmatocola sphagniphila]|uniref:HEAT repeat domain-containing protein n=1 Tax=Telmatocola sphagniphila TaxID=1123043 RepID=A0A8E6EV97_9BACT|nr:hypothetical protein [Telmatocola sphagniphila]QVL32440.1 hypothetical protein KIH39_00545 [Telmatocola sphagniphila]